MSGTNAIATESQKKSETRPQPEQEPVREGAPAIRQPGAPQAALQRARLHPALLRPAEVVALQRAVGNRRVQGLVARPAKQRSYPYQIERQSSDHHSTAQASTQVYGNRHLLSGGERQSAVSTIQRYTDEAGNVLPDAINVVWGGDPFQIEFRRTPNRGDRFSVTIRYTGSHTTDGPFVRDKTKVMSLDIGSKTLSARIRRQSPSSIEVDLYGDNVRLVKLVDNVEVDDRPTSKGRRHDFKLLRNGRFAESGSFWVLDPSAKASDLAPNETEESPGENPSSFLRFDERGSFADITIDGDGDQSKELNLKIRAKSYWPGKAQKDAAKTVNLQIMQRSSKIVKEINFDLPEPRYQGSLFPIVKEVTDGKALTTISLILPSDSQTLEIQPPTRTKTEVEYLVTAGGKRFSFSFPPETDEIQQIASASPLKIIGNIVSTDISLGAYEDRFRLTLTPTSLTKAIFGISPLTDTAALGGAGTEVDIVANSEGKALFNLLNVGPLSIGLDFNQDDKPDLQIFDQLTTPQEADGGGPPESNRNHRIRVTGPAVGSDQLFYFQVRDGFLMGSYFDSGVGKAVASNAQAVSELTEQAEEGTFEQQLDAYESLLMAQRKQAADSGLIRKATYDAWAAMSLAMIKLRPQIKKTVDPTLQSEAAKQAKAFYDSLADETKFEKERLATEGFSSVSSNPYTDELTTVAPFVSTSSGAGPELAGDIKAGRWSKALTNYQQLVSGLDAWIVNRLKTVKGEYSAETRRAGLLAGRKRELGAIEKHNPKRILAAFHPNEKFKGEQGYVSSFPLALYYWKEGDTWHLKDVTNPEHTYDYTVDAAANAQEPPLGLMRELNDPDHFPVGVIYYDIPGKYGGQIRTTDHLTWKKFFSYLGLGLAAVGLTLATFGTGTVAVAGGWVLAGSAFAGATSATIDLIERDQQGNLDATTAIIDIAQIVGSLAGASALASGRIVQAAANAPAGARWAGNWARLAMFANKLYIPMVGTTAVADVVSFAVIAQDTAKQLDEIENSPGDRAAKDRAKALLLSQLAVMGGLTALSVKGTIPELTKGRTLVLHPGPDGVPVVSTALTSKSVVIDTNTAIALDKKAKGLKLQPGEEAMVKKIEALGDVELRVADVTVAERASIGEKVMQPGIAVTVDRTGKEYQDILKILTDKKVGKAKGVADRSIVADTFFAVPESGVTPTFVTHDPGIYNNMARITGYEPAEALPVPQKFPNGFDVTINGRTIKVIPLPKT